MSDHAEPPERGQPRKAAWRGVIRRTLREFNDDHITDLAAGLTYYGVLAIFPTLIVILSVLGLIGTSATQPILENLNTVAPGPAKSILSGAVSDIQSHQGTAGLTFFVGLVVALWSASGYIGAFMRAANVVWDVPEGRPFYKTLPIRFGITVLTVVLLTLSVLAVVFTGSLAGRLGQLLGVGSTVVMIWDIVKWPVMLLNAAGILAILYYTAPNVRQPGFRWVSAGSVLAVVLWLLASAAFAAYVANFGSYNKTYGALASAVVFLIWLWITNIAILLGAELNAELERGRRMAAGASGDVEPYAPLREEPKPRKAIS
jgi:membrane protein